MNGEQTDRDTGEQLGVPALTEPTSRREAAKLNSESLALQRRFQRWLTLPDGSLRVFLGWSRRTSVAGFVVALMSAGFHMAAMWATRELWMLILLPVDVACIIGYARIAACRPTFATITHDSVFLSVLLGDRRIALSEVTSLSIGQGPRLLYAGQSSRIVMEPFVQICTPLEVTLFTFRYHEELSRFTDAIESRLPNLRPGPVRSHDVPQRIVSLGWATNVGRKVFVGLALFCVALVGPAAVFGL
jgi:hypothetical protein